MKGINRITEPQITNLSESNKVILILGTRRVGKTFYSIQKNYQSKLLFLNGEDFDVQEVIKNRSTSNYKRIKSNKYLNKTKELYFWRNYNQQEIDLIEVRDGMIASFEFKYTDNKKAKQPPSFKTLYPESTFEVISRDNYLDFVVG